MNLEHKKLFFYNAIPMPHSVLLHQRLVDYGYRVNFWYYKNLTTIYPWSALESSVQYNVYKKKSHQVKTIFQQAAKADFIIITGWHTYLHVLLMLFAKASGKKYALWIDLHPEEKNNWKHLRNMLLLKMAPYLFITGRVGFEIIKNSYAINTDKMRDFPYLTAEFDKVTVKEVNDERKELIASGQKIKLLISNRFIARKGYNIIVEAFKLIPASILSSFEITIVGNGTEYEFFKDSFLSIDKNIKLIGWIEYKEYLDYVLGCDIFLHASLVEPFGIPPMDAMACGKLVIGSSAVISCIDRIIHGVNGFIYKKEKPLELAELLQYISRNKMEIYKIGEKAFETANIYTPAYNIVCIDEIFPKLSLQIHK